MTNTSLPIVYFSEDNNKKVKILNNNKNCFNMKIVKQNIKDFL
jgi:hypothetical protein